MSFISTALGALGKVANIALTGATVATLFKKPAAMPGGAMIPQPMYGGGTSMAGYGLPLLGAGMGLGALGLTTPGSPYGGIMEPGGFLGGGSQINPIQTRGGYRMPHQVMVPHPSQPGNYVTYVKAPPVRYRVSVRGYKRRCSSGGR